MSAITANLVWMFTEAGDDIPSRIRAAAAHGLDAVEIWGWRGHDLDAIENALAETHVRLLSMIVEPQLQLADPATHQDYLRAVEECLAVAVRLGCPNLVIATGAERPGVPRQEQWDAVIDVLRRAGAQAKGTGVTLLLENLNLTVDHVGSLIGSAGDALQLVRAVDSPSVKLLLDAYHALVMHEDLAQVIRGHIDLIGHVQVADMPGRAEPGTGTIDWREQLLTLRSAGYPGYFGMEYRPSRATADSLREIERIVAEIDAR